MAQAAQHEAIGVRTVKPGVRANRYPFRPSDGMRNAAVFGLHETDAVQLAERARWD